MKISVTQVPHVGNKRRLIAPFFRYCCIHHCRKKNISTLHNNSAYSTHKGSSVICLTL